MDETLTSHSEGLFPRREGGFGSRERSIPILFLRGLQKLLFHVYSLSFACLLGDGKAGRRPDKSRIGLRIKGQFLFGAWAFTASLKLSGCALKEGSHRACMRRYLFNLLPFLLRDGEDASSKSPSSGCLIRFLHDFICFHRFHGRGKS